MVCGSPLDVLASALRKASESLAEITGDEVSEKLIQEIFSRFCVGK
jgi:tRNA modification GTPase